MVMFAIASVLRMRMMRESQVLIAMQSILGRYQGFRSGTSAAPHRSPS